MENIRLIKCQFESVSTLIGVINCNDKIVLIDSGTEACARESILMWFYKNNISIDKIHMIINTHTHGDHIGGNKILKKLNDNILIAVHEEGIEKIKKPFEAGMKIRKRYSNYLPVQLLEKLKGMDTDLILKDNDILDINDTKLKIIYTPGHDTDCICIYEPESKTLFTGDSIQGGGTVATGIAFYQNLKAYNNTIKKIEAMDIENMILGHSFYPSDGIINGKRKVREFIEFSLKCINEYGLEINHIIQSGDKDLLSITKKLINKKGFYKNPPFIFLAMHTVDEHIKNNLL